jgi:cytidylate kinase
MWASNVSTREVVRKDLVARQQKMARAKGFVMDGRDIGTVVLTDAELKVFQTASVEARAKRRYLENQSKGLEANYEEIYRDIELRDYQDTHREVSPLTRAEDAILLDTSDMSIEEVTNHILELVEEKMK